MRLSIPHSMPFAPIVDSTPLQLPRFSAISLRRPRQDGLDLDHIIFSPAARRGREREGEDDRTGTLTAGGLIGGKYSLNGRSQILSAEVGRDPGRPLAHSPAAGPYPPLCYSTAPV
jgi:hypothetical protein